MKETFPGNIQRIKFQSSCKQLQLFFLTANLLITSSTLYRFLVLWMCNIDKFDNLSSPIVALRQFFTRRIALNERSLDAEDTGIVINTVKIA